MHLTALLLGLGKDLSQRGPEAQRTVADREFRLGSQAALLEVEQQPLSRISLSKLLSKLLSKRNSRDNAMVDREIATLPMAHRKNDEKQTLTQGHVLRSLRRYRWLNAGIGLMNSGLKP